MHKDIVNLAVECRSCTGYGKSAKYIIPKNASKPLQLLTQPGQEIQLDYAGPLEDDKGKNTLAGSNRQIFKTPKSKNHKINRGKIVNKTSTFIYRHAPNTEIIKNRPIFRV